MGNYVLVMTPCTADPDHIHARFSVAGWKHSLSENCTEYFDLTGICTPARAKAILAALNADALARLEAAE